jgi:hypothetical protein
MIIGKGIIKGEQEERKEISCIFILEISLRSLLMPIL